MNSFPSKPLWTVADEVRQVVDPGTISGDVVHYNIPALEATGEPTIEPATDIGSGKLLLRGDEVLISRLNPRKSRVVRTVFAPLPILASTEFVPLRPVDCDPRFLTYCLLSETTRQLLDSEVRSVTRSHQRVDPIQITRLAIPSPDQASQRRIADFLDEQVRRLDRAITLRQHQAEALNLRQTSEVQQALDAHAHGEIRLKYLCRGPGEYGLNVPAGQYVDDGDGVRMLRTSDIATPDSWREVKGIFVPRTAVSQETELAAGDILVSRAGTIGRAFVAPPEVAGMTFAGFLIRFRTAPDVDPRFIALCLASALVQAQVREGAITSTIDNFNAERYGDLRLPLIDRKRRVALVDWAESAARDYSTANTVLRRSISLLEERKQALITAAVNGEFDVTTARAVA